MRNVSFLALVTAATVSCNSMLAEPDLFGQCLPSVRVNDRLYSPTLVGETGAHRDTLPASQVRTTEIHAEVTRTVGCNDTNLDETGIEKDGDSNFLAVGTTLHRVKDAPADRRLAVNLDGSWVALFEID